MISKRQVVTLLSLQLSSSFLHTTAPLAPLKNSDRKKLRQRVLAEFHLEAPNPVDDGTATNEVGDLLVPDGLQSVKITTHSGEAGVCDGRSYHSTSILKRTQLLSARLHTCQGRVILSGFRWERVAQNSYQQVRANKVDFQTIPPHSLQC